MSTVKLNWDTASAQMLTSVKEIWADEGFANVTLAFEDESVIHTNRTLLAAISPIMRSFLKDKNTRNSKIFMFGMESSIVTALLDFIFREEIFFEQDKLDLFFSTASKLKINGFMEGKAEDSKLNPIGFTKGKEEDKNQQNDVIADNNLLVASQKDKKQDLFPTNVETNTSDLNHSDFEIDLSQNIAKEDPLQIIKEDNNQRKYKVDGRTQRKSTRLEVDEEIVDEKRGISCFYCKAAGTVDHDRFPTLDELHKHERDVHMRDTSSVYNCEQCGLEFYKMVVFNQHKRKEHPENPTEGVCCDICGRSYKSKAKMEKHRDYSHPVPGKMFKCRIADCQKESRTKNASNVHYYQSHTEKQRKEFEGKL